MTDGRRGQDAAHFWLQAEQHAVQHSHLLNNIAALQATQAARMEDEGQLEQEDELVPEKIRAPAELEHRRLPAAMHNCT